MCWSYKTYRLLHFYKNEYVDVLLIGLWFDQDLNTTELFAPVVDTFIPPEEAFLGRDPQVALQKGDFHKVRVITGVAESEGVAMLSNFLHSTIFTNFVQTVTTLTFNFTYTHQFDLIEGVIRNLAKRSYDELAHIFLTASIPRAVDFYGFHEAWPAVYRTIRYQYFDRVDRKDKVGMLQQMLQVSFLFELNEPNKVIQIKLLLIGWYCSFTLIRTTKLHTTTSWLV